MIRRATTCRRAALLLVLVPALVAATQLAGSRGVRPAAAQEPDKPLLEETQHDRPQLERPRKRTMPQLPPRIDLNRRLVELDRLLSLGSLVRAETLLEGLAQHAFLERDLIPRRIVLAKLKGEHEAAIDLCREALKLAPGSARLHRELAGSLLALERAAEAYAALTNFVSNSPNRRSSMIVAVDMLATHDEVGAALAMCDSARVALAEPRFLGRQRALLLLADDRDRDAAAEIVQELRGNPHNLPLVRSDLLTESVVAGIDAGFIQVLHERLSEDGAVAAERLFVADIHLARRDVASAREAIQPLLIERLGCQALLQNVAAIAKEAPLIADRAQRQLTTEYLLSVLEEMATASALDHGSRPRLLEILARACEEALADGLLGDEPRLAAERFERLLNIVKRGNRHSAHLYSAQIRLAHFTRDELGRPDQAAARLERLLADLDLPDEGVALARLTLGECYLAAGDTARGRLVLTRLGRGKDFRAAAGHAHFHLARLDLAEGHYGTARDRFAVVAMDNPAAPYANDALDLGLAVAEELENPTGGPVVLDLYARGVYFDLVAKPDSQTVALERFVRATPLRVDLTQPQHLLERGRYELAHLYWSLGRGDEALAQCERIVADHPDGRYPAAALALRGVLLAGRDEKDLARLAYERLLNQYSDYLFVDDVRDSLRSLP